MKKPRFYFASFLLIVIGLWVYFLFSSTVQETAGVSYYVKPGTTKSTVISELAEQGIIKHPLLFSLYAYPQIGSHLKTAEYFFPKGSSPVSIWRQMTTGTGLLQHKFTIIPGWTFAQLRRELAKAIALRQDTAAWDDKQIMRRLDSATLAPEGEFFPDTYYYTRGISDFIILKRAFDLMQLKLNMAWNNRAANLPYKNAYEALIAASLIEKEAYLSEERPLIAGVLINRLRKDMLLQFDPTVIYGLGPRYAGKIYKSDLMDNNPYNTYVHKGLPPTPIAMPSQASINAALQPTEHDYYYFVAKGHGAHQFSKTLRDHKVAVTETVKPTTYFNDGKVKQYMHRILMASAASSYLN